MSAFTADTGKAHVVRVGQPRRARKVRSTTTPAAHLARNDFIPASTADLWKAGKPRRYR